MNLITFALCGAPNCGKTTLFNFLTGETQRTGNWPGVTVERTEGIVRTQLLPAGCASNVHVVDLPGACSLSPFSPEEGIALQYLRSEKPQAVLCVINACAPAQGLSLALQLMTLSLPLVLVFNQMDLLQAYGGKIDTKKIASALQTPSVCISARSGEGVEAMLRRMLSTAARPVSYKAPVPFDPPAAFASYAQHAAQRYALIDALLKDSFQPGKNSRLRTHQIDRLLMHPFGWPILLLLLAAAFLCAFGAPGQWLAGLFSSFMQNAASSVDLMLAAAHTPPLMRSLLTDGVFRGLVAVISFLPTMLLFFMLTAVLEDSGLLSRAAFLLDAPLRRLGLSGRSFFPMMTGFGCTVPAVMAARTLPNRREKLMTSLLVPYLPCGAKIPVYLFLSALILPTQSGWGVLFCYFLGIAALILLSFPLRKALRAAPSPLVMELPAYRMPTLRGIARVMQDKTRDFLSRAFTVIFFTSLVIWFLQYFTPSFTPAPQVQDSLLFEAAAFLSPIFAPLGFSSPPLIAALIAGLLAKENILTVLLLFTPDASLFPSSAAALSYMTFIALYAPCLASCAVLARECQSRRRMLLSVLFQTAVAWLAALIIYQLFS